MTKLFTAWPILAALVWVVLHATDFYLTLLGALAYRRVQHVIQFSGSYELNPVFQGDVDKLRWWSPRFLVTLLVGALALFFLAVLSPRVGVEDVLGFLLGAVLFTRLMVITRHVHNLYLFNRLQRTPNAMQGSIRYGKRTTNRLAALSSVSWGAIIGAAAIVAAGHPWLLGGSSGLFAIGAIAYARSMRLKDLADAAT